MGPIRAFLAKRSYSFWTLQICGWACYAILSFSAKVGEGGSPSWIWFYAGVALGGLIVTSILRLGYRHVWQWPTPPRLAASIALLLVATLVQMKIFVGLLPFFCDDCNFPNLFHYIWYFVSMLYLLLSWSGMYFGIKSSRQLQAQKEAALKAQAMAHEAQLKMLRYQLNPHFLFNTLNAISTLVLDNRPQTANGMVGSLSAFLRYSLDSDPVQRVTLAQEIDATNLYLGIEQLRFGERLRVKMRIDDDTRDALVPSLILQPLIENAIKHAVSKREEGGTIEIETRRDGDALAITLRDDGPGCAPDASRNGRGVGLANTRERLRVLYGVHQQFTIANHEPHGLEIGIRMPYERAKMEKAA
ncbi:MAG TPA: histidine kinase [Rudaea sp.]|nr:histidine kinase [Rudaea sp.]